MPYKSMAYSFAPSDVKTDGQNATHAGGGGAGWPQAKSPFSVHIVDFHPLKLSIFL
jgi:hypothetical protein